MKAKNKSKFRELRRKAPTKAPPTSCPYFDSALTHIKVLANEKKNYHLKIAIKQIEKARRVNNKLRVLAHYWRTTTEQLLSDDK
jgi:hypothetical protein